MQRFGYCVNIFLNRSAHICFPCDRPMLPAYRCFPPAFAPVLQREPNYIKGCERLASVFLKMLSFLPFGQT